MPRSISPCEVLSIAAAALAEPALTEGRDDRAVFDGLLDAPRARRAAPDGPRQVQLGRGRRAVISEGTVKFHVNNILRKLHAANRAEAASRYLRLTGGRVRE